MKYIKYLTIIFIVVFFFIPISAFANDYKKVTSYKKDTITITSYSKAWNQYKLKQLYEELIKNTTSLEFTYLKEINIYPDSPDGVNGLYFEDVNIVDGKYIYGKNSIINLYNGDKYNTVALMANILSHEYGHHYTLFNMLNKENIYYNNIENSKYAKLRQIDKFPKYFIGYSKDYEYQWDLLEILADDYVQLLGSPLAKISKDYSSVDELLINKNLNNSGIYFNLKPSINPYIPLATEVDGLYSYLLELGGYTFNTPNIKQLPVLSNVKTTKSLNGEISYKIEWTEAIGNGPFEYTLIMYPTSNPLSPIPLKTVRTGEKLEAIFGSYSIKDKNNKIKSISNTYEGEFEIKLFIKDKNNFIYDSKPVRFNFSNSKVVYKNTNKNKQPSDSVVIGPKFPNKNSLSNILISS